MTDTNINSSVKNSKYYHQRVMEKFMQKKVALHGFTLQRIMERGQRY